jgi:cytochrome c
MKKLLFACMLAALISCKEEAKKETPALNTEEVSEGEMANMTASEKLGQEIFNGKGNCFSCHKPDQKIIGPSIKEIARIYKEKNGDMIAFLKGDGEPIVDPAQYAVMKTNFAITKNFSEEELKAVEDYIYSFN